MFYIHQLYGKSIWDIARCAVCYQQSANLNVLAASSWQVGRQDYLILNIKVTTMQISIFNFNQSNVRVQFVNNEPIFCLTDVAEILQIKNPNPTRFNLNQKGVHKMYTPTKGGNQEITFINEPNLYRVIFRSNKPEAVKFQDWMFEEVIPQIRKTGSYQTSGSLKTKTALPNGLTLEQQDEIKKLHRQLVQATPKEKQAKLAIQLWSSIKSKFGVSYKEVAPEHYPEVLSLMARVAVENATLTGELLDKPIQSTVRLEEFELIRVMEFLSNRYMEMQTASCVARAIYPLNPQMAKNMKSEFDRDFPLLKGIAHTFQRFSGSLKDPLCAKEFEMHAKYLQGANLAW